MSIITELNNNNNNGSLQPESEKAKKVGQSIKSINQSTLFKHGKWLSKLVFRHAM